MRNAIRNGVLAVALWLQKRALKGIVLEHRPPSFNGTSKERRMKENLYLRGFRDGYLKALVDRSVTRAPIVKTERIEISDRRAHAL